MDEEVDKNDLSNKDDTDSDLGESEMNNQIEDQLEVINNKIKNKENKKLFRTSLENNDINYKFNNNNKEEKHFDKKLFGIDYKDFVKSYISQNDDYYPVYSPDLYAMEFNIEPFNELIKNKKLQKLKDNISIYSMKIGNNDKENKNTKHNKLCNDNLYYLMYELINKNFNVLLYGFGSKIELIYKFITYFMDKNKINDNTRYYIISCNLSNNEMNIKVILSKIQDCIIRELKSLLNSEDLEKQLKKSKTNKEHIQRLKTFYITLIKKKKDPNAFKNDDEYDNTEIEGGKNKENIDKKNNKEDIDEINEFPFKILLIIHNISSSIARNKSFQQNLGELIKQLNFVNLVATCNNLIIPYFWSSETSDNFKYIFPVFDSFIINDYDEMDDIYLTKGDVSFKTGVGLKEIFDSLTDPQNKLLQEIAILQLNNDFEKLTAKGLVDHFMSTGKGIITTIQKLGELINEPLDHGIICCKKNNDINQEIYKFNLEKNCIQEIAEGKYLRKNIE